MSGFATVQAVVDKLIELFAAENIPAEVRLGKSALAEHKNNRLGQVVIIPTTATIGGPRLTGARPVAHYAVQQGVDVYITAAAAKNTVNPTRQYGDNLSQVLARASDAAFAPSIGPA